jgi:hypothetical protein
MNDKTLTAFVWRTGRLQIAREVPEGALPLATAPDTVLLEAIVDTAREAEGGTAFFVPGVQEVEDGDAKVDAVLDYQRILNKRLASDLASQTGGSHANAAPRI